MIHDFGASETIYIDDFTFGETHKYVQLDVSADDIQKYNEAVIKADLEYTSRIHNLCCDNCHSHVAMALNLVKYQGKENWTMLDVWWMTIRHSKYVSCSAFLKTYLAFIVVMGLILAAYFVGTGRP